VRAGGPDTADLGHDDSVPANSTKGKLLLATPPLVDPNFDRTVVYMLEHNDQGALGVVVNRPTDEAAIEGLDVWCELLSPPAVVFAGGPVELDALIGLAWTGDADAQVEAVDLGEPPTEAAPVLARFRLFRGYSGWSPGQLDAELEAGAWIVLAARTTDVFCEDPDGLWRAVLRRQGGRLAWIADAPDDLSAN
jgi:putative transcriptional regulator